MELKELSLIPAVLPWSVRSSSIHLPHVIYFHGKNRGESSEELSTSSGGQPPELSSVLIRFSLKDSPSSYWVYPMPHFFLGNLRIRRPLKPQNSMSSLELPEVSPPRYCPLPQLAMAALNVKRSAWSGGGRLCSFRWSRWIDSTGRGIDVGCIWKLSMSTTMVTPLQKKHFCNYSHAIQQYVVVRITLNTLSRFLSRLNRGW